MWLLKSSIGKKLIMSISGLFLILFLTFHVCMNLVVLISPESYDAICAFLGANWYALVGTAVLAAGMIVHILYAFVLYMQNRKARGKNAYSVTARPKSVEWASQNMLALGIAIAAFLGLHLFNFWAKMQLVEIMHNIGINVSNEALAKAQQGSVYIAETFSNPVFVAIYSIGLIALWFHLTHGFWSALQSMGINNKIWFNRWKAIANIYVTCLILGFASVVFVFFFK